MHVTGLDHLVLLVADVRRSLAFYVDVLGLEPDRLTEWEAGEAPFPSVRVDAGTIIDLFERSGPDDRAGPADANSSVNVDHFCLVVDDDIDTVAARDDLDVEFGPATLYGARGQGRSIYVRDPDGNRVELRSYGA